MFILVTFQSKYLLFLLLTLSAIKHSSIMPEGAQHLVEVAALLGKTRMKVILFFNAKNMKLR